MGVSVCFIGPSSIDSVPLFGSVPFITQRAAFRLGSSFRAVSQAFFLSFDCCRDILGLAFFCLRRLLSVVFILVLRMAASSVLSASVSALFYTFFYQYRLLNGLVIVIIPYVSYLLILLSGRRRHGSHPVAGWFHS